jgi:alpha,alpha-trehalase
VRNRIRIFLPAILLAAALSAQQAAKAPFAPIEVYIKKMWITLTRSDNGLALGAPDPKFQPLASGRWPVYIPAGGDLKAIEAQLRQDMAPADFKNIELRALPANTMQVKDQGLLYLPLPYVVPGGRFNEMYGWDSYFIQLGLLRDNELDLAKDMADNFLYEIRNYGKILNANRTYYLTRSQPPFLTEMLLGVYARTKDRKWLSDAVPAVESYYRFWMSEPHLTLSTGLSRYYDLGDGPAPESLSAERDAEGFTHYDRVKEYYKTHEVTDYDVNEFYDSKRNALTDLFYKGDRSMRESGFDPSNRFGPFSVDVIHYDPVCLNSLLYAMETQTAEILGILGRDADGAVWRKRASERAERIHRLMWDAQDGLFYDYNFVGKKVRHYPFLSTFYPLWAGVATKAEAAAVEKNLPKFERSGGLVDSTYESGQQWDAPFGWAPLELIALDGLRRYGYNEDANRISEKFLSMVKQEYEKVGFIVEKYDVVRRGTDSSSIKFGYQSNQQGFGWTNAAYTRLLDAMSAQGAR